MSLRAAGRRPNPYESDHLDRVGDRRRDTEWLAEMLAHPESLFLPVWRGLSLVVPGDAPSAVMLTAARAARLINEVDALGRPAILLGVAEGRAHFALDLSHLDDREAGEAVEPAGQFVDIREVGPLMGPEDGSILITAKGLIWWHQRHRFCGVCGAPTESREAGHLRVCSNPSCGTTHFPRTDPAVIMLVVDGDNCLLGRQKRWREGMYSTLAGFVEPGESLEQAVAREVREESGIDVVDVTYHSSQPWPFPSSLMLGFRARAITREIRRADDELEDVQWFTRDQVVNFEKLGKRMPRMDSIARRLIEDWLES